MRRSLIAPVAFLSLLAGGAVAQAKTILLHPKDGSAVAQTSLTLLGAVEAADEKAQVALNGAPVAIAVKPNGVFAQAVRLQPGLNLLTVEGRTVRVDLVGRGQPLPIGFRERVLHSPVPEDCGNCHGLAQPGDFSVQDKIHALCLGCHDDPALGKDGKRKAVVHSPIADGGDCLSCHDPHVGDAGGMTTRPQPDLCYECHDKVAGKSHDHAPVAAGKCTSCHDPHSAPYASLVREKGRRLCLACHKDPGADPKQADRNMPVIHGALDEGCLSCHAPHGSAVRGALRKPQIELCWDCHDQGQSKTKGIVVHSPIRDDRECTTCHRPHSGVLPKLLNSAVPALCIDCHDAAAKPRKAGEKVHGPVAQGTCIACHSPHAGPGRMMVKKVTEVCFDCHPKVPPLPGGSNHAPVDGGECLSCHFGHSGSKGLLVKKTPALCYDCHEDVSKKDDGKNFARVHSPVEEGDCRSCHAHHFSLYPHLLAARGNSLCMGCHDDPGLGPGKAMWPYVHQPVSGNCLSCHFAHASDQKGMIRGPVFYLCSGCHRSHGSHVLGAAKYLENRKGSMVTIPENFPLNAEGKMVCTGCHFAHGGEIKNLLKVERDRLCLDCHPK
jgi:predicted CXXCH cytochrome family protein